MDNARERALRLLGFDQDEIDYCEPLDPHSEAELIGLLLLELDRLVDGQFTLTGAYSGLQRPTVMIRVIPHYQGDSILEALTLAVEKVREADRG